jgi:hypothetical protein
MLKNEPIRTWSVENKAKKWTDQVLDWFKMMIKNEPIKNLIGLKQWLKMNRSRTWSVKNNA